MKTIKSMLLASMAMLTCLNFSACSDNNDNPTPGTGDVFSKVHFDVWVSVGESGGMGSGAALVVKNVPSLSDKDTIDFKNQGADVTAKLYQESIIKGRYYYQIPREKDRFGKYTIENGKIVTVAERPFAKNTYLDRRYTHTFINGNTLVIMAANGDKNDVIWTKINTDDMSIIAEGALGLPEKTPQVKTYSTSGIAKYRSKDNKIIYLYSEKHKDGEKRVYAALINPADMKVENVTSTTVGEDLAGSAYGELLQSKAFFDDQDNLYVPLVSRIPGSETSTCAYSRIVRIKAGSKEFDTAYTGFKMTEFTGKIVTCDYIGNNKAILYIQDPVKTGLSSDPKLKKGWGNDYNCYYAIYDIATDRLSEIECQGTLLPFSSGTFSQRSFVLGGKVFIGVNPKKGNPCIYVYDSRTGKTVKGATIAEGYEFNRIVYVNNQ